MKSIRRQLLVWLLGGLVLAIIAAAFGTYFRAREEANALFDYQLKEMAASLTDAPFAPAPAGVGALGPGSNALRGADLGSQRRAALSVAAAPRAAAERATRLHHRRTPSSGAWRVFSTLAGEPGRAGRAADERAPRARHQHGFAHRRAAAAGAAGARAY